MMTLVQEIATLLTSGNRRALSKAITLIESTRNEDEIQAQELLNSLQKKRETIRIGISGVPGVGKSTFIESFGNHIINQGKRVSVLAVDPSSPTSGGSILGDKIRMENLAKREEAFIRPSPSAGNLGGVAKKTRETIALCEAAGYDVILVETVGVGQSEFEVASMVDCFLVLMLPGAGDSLQGIKRGILEITDLLVINKADGEQQRLAERAKNEYTHAFNVVQSKYPGLETKILTCSALENKNIDVVWDSVAEFIKTIKDHGIFEQNRTRQQLDWFRRHTEQLWKRKLWDKDGRKKFEEAIISGKMTPVQAAQALIAERLTRL